MTKKLFIGMLFAVAAMNVTAGDKNVKAVDENVSFTGRVEKLDDGSVRYDWVGVYMQTQFTGTRVAVDISDTGTSYHNVFIDGQLKEKIKVTGKERHTVVLADKLKKGTHTTHRGVWRFLHRGIRHRGQESQRTICTRNREL